MTTRNAGTDPPPYSNEDYRDQPSGYIQEQPYYVTPPPDYDMVIQPPENKYPKGKVPVADVWHVQPYIISVPHSENATHNQADVDELDCDTLNMDETNSAKIEASFAENPDGFGFSDASIRRGFIRKVYLILTVQLLITAGIISIFVFYKPVGALARNRTFWIVVGSFSIILAILIICCDEIRRKSPINYILLGLFTVAESLLVGLISSRYRGDIVLMAMGMTAVICFGLTLFAFQTRFDFTICGSLLFISFLFLVVIGITVPLLYKYGEKNQILYLVFASAGAIILSIYFIADTQLMMAGHKDSLSPEEYIYAALNLYIDIIYIFMYLLKILRYLYIS